MMRDSAKNLLMQQKQKIKKIVNLFAQNVSEPKLMTHLTSAFVLELVVPLQDGAVYTKVTTNSTAADAGSGLGPCAALKVTNHANREQKGEVITTVVIKEIRNQSLPKVLTASNQRMRNNSLTPEIPSSLPSFHSLQRLEPESLRLWNNNTQT